MLYAQDCFNDIFFIIFLYQLIGQMDQEQVLSYYGKQIIRAINPNLIDRLQCDICMQDFNSTNRKAVQMCPNHHQNFGVCLFCYCKQAEKAEPKCHICRAPILNPSSDDLERQQKVKVRDHLLLKLGQLSRNTKEITRAQSEKKLHEIIERAEKQMGKSTEESKKKSMQVERLQTKLKRMMQNERQKQRAAEQLAKRQQQLFQREKQHKETMQQYMKERLLLENQLLAKNQLINKLSQQNRQLRTKLRGSAQIEQLQERVSHKRRAQFPIYNDGHYYRSFKFYPEKNQAFIDYFIENKSSKLIELNQRKELEFRGVGTRKMLFHNETFNAKNEEDMLLCFKVRAHNKRVPVYKFGLCDEKYNQFKDAYISLFLKHDLSYEFPYQITFYVNLTNKKLYATSSKESTSKQLPTDLQFSKFKIYYYFSDIKTQVTFHK